MIRILLVDDSEAVRNSVSRLLEGEEDILVVDQAADGIQAIERAAELQPDVVLLDISLPHMSGLKAAPEIRKVAPAARILFLSQHDSAQMVKQAFSTGALGYVLKSDAGRELADAVHAVCEGERFLSSQLARAQREQRLAVVGGR